MNISSTPSESYVELRYFSPFDIHKIPTRILEAVHEQAIGRPHDDLEPHQLTLPDLLLVICNYEELKNAIRKELIKFHT